MQKLNLLQKFILIFIVSIFVISCSSDSTEPQNEIVNQSTLALRTSDKNYLEETNEAYNDFTKSKVINVSSYVSSIKSDLPQHYDYYIESLNREKTDMSIDEVVHVTIIADNEFEEIEVYTIRYTENEIAKGMVIIENKFADNTLVYDAEIVEDGKMPVIDEHEIVSPIFDQDVAKVKFSTACYKACIGGMMSSISFWHIAAVGFVCPACAAAFFGAAILGCGGGCFVTVW